MIRYLALCVVCALVYYGCIWLNFPTSGLWFYVEMSSWSLIICAAAYYLSGSRAAIMVGVLECAAIAVNLVSGAQEVTSPGLIWAKYDQIIAIIAGLEVLALIAGAPWDGIRRMVRERWGSANHRSPAYMRGVLDSQEGQT